MKTYTQRKTFTHYSKIISLLTLITLAALITLKKETFFNSISKGATTYETLVREDISIKDYCHQQLNKQGDVIWNELNQSYGVDKQRCAQQEQTVAQQYKRAALNERNNAPRTSLSPEIKQLVTNVLKDFGVNPRNIAIVPYKEKAYAAADSFTIFINESEMNTLSHEEQRFVIGHELGHMLYQDNLTEYALSSLMQAKKQQTKKDRQKIARLHEMRADINALTKDIDYAQGGVNFFKRLLNDFGEGSGTSHPKASDRLEQSQLVLNLLKQEAQYHVQAA